MEDGKPKLQIFDSCPSLIRELPNLKIKAGTDDVDKVNDHLSDALRYAIMSRMPHPEKEEEDDDPSDRAAVWALRRKEIYEDAQRQELIL